MWTIQFWKAAGERALWTFAQSALATLGVIGIGFGDVNWITIASVGGVAAIASVLKSIVVNGATGDGPSITKAEQTVARDEVVVPVELAEAGIDATLAEHGVGPR